MPLPGPGDTKATTPPRYMYVSYMNKLPLLPLFFFFFLQNNLRAWATNTSQPRVISVGPWGGPGGQPFRMRGTSVPHLRAIIVYHSNVSIHALACEYSLAGDDEDANGEQRVRMAGPWGIPHSFGSRRVRFTVTTGPAGPLLLLLCVCMWIAKLHLGVGKFLCRSSCLQGSTSPRWRGRPGTSATAPVSSSSLR